MNSEWFGTVCQPSSDSLAMNPLWGPRRNTNGHALTQPELAKARDQIGELLANSWR